jgi:hypothetical protein
MAAGKRKPLLTVWKFASCDSCQLSLLDCEDELPALAGAVEIAHFPEATRGEIRDRYDVSLIEGSIITAHDAERIRDVRRRSRVLVTIGVCATAGGVQALRNFAEKRVGLSYLIPMLDRDIRWDRELTADEQQHLSFARLLVHRPRWVISDEALCHLNEDDRKLMFSLFERELSKSSVVSITSNDAQHDFYRRIFHLSIRSLPLAAQSP